MYILWDITLLYALFSEISGHRNIKKKTQARNINEETSNSNLYGRCQNRLVRHYFYVEMDALVDFIYIEYAHKALSCDGNTNIYTKVKAVSILGIMHRRSQWSKGSRHRHIASPHDDIMKPCPHCRPFSSLILPVTSASLHKGPMMQRFDVFFAVILINVLCVEKKNTIQLPALWDALALTFRHSRSSWSPGARHHLKYVWGLWATSWPVFVIPCTCRINIPVGQWATTNIYKYIMIVEMLFAVHLTEFIQII